MFEPFLDGHLAAFGPKVLTPVPLLPIVCSLAAVAREAASDQIVAGGKSSPCFGMHVIQSRIASQRLRTVRATVPECQEYEVAEADLLSTLRDEDRLIDGVIHRVA